jgi:hypothetical protein
VANGLKFKEKIWGSEKVSEMVKGKEIKAKVALLHNSKVTKICLFSAILMGEIFI